jgi:tetratricopeptide (TPR) repeat protein
LNNLAIACLHMKRYDEALSLAEKALQLIPESDEVKDTVKQIREARQKAKEDASKAQESPAGKPEGAQTPPIAATNAPAQAASSNAVPTDAYAVFAVGMTHFGKEEWGPAVEHFTRCVAQKPDEPMFQNYLAKSLYRKGSYAEALKHARKALELQPGSKDVQETIRQIEKAQNDAKGTKKAVKPDPKKVENKPDPKKVGKKPPPKKAGKTPEGKKPQNKKPEKPAKDSGAPAGDVPELEGQVPKAS